MHVGADANLFALLEATGCDVVRGDDAWADLLEGGRWVHHAADPAPHVVATMAAGGGAVTSIELGDVVHVS